MERPQIFLQLCFSKIALPPVQVAPSEVCAWGGNPLPLYTDKAGYDHDPTVFYYVLESPKDTSMVSGQVSVVVTADLGDVSVHAACAELQDNLSQPVRVLATSKPN